MTRSTAIAVLLILALVLGMLAAVQPRLWSPLASLDNAPGPFNPNLPEDEHSLRSRGT